MTTVVACGEAGRRSTRVTVESALVGHSHDGYVPFSRQRLVRFTLAPGRPHARTVRACGQPKSGVESIHRTASRAGTPDNRRMELGRSLLRKMLSSGPLLDETARSDHGTVTARVAVDHGWHRRIVQNAWECGGTPGVYTTRACSQSCTGLRQYGHSLILSAQQARTLWWPHGTARCVFAPTMHTMHHSSGRLHQRSGVRESRVRDGAAPWPSLAAVAVCGGLQECNLTARVGCKAWRVAQTCGVQCSP